MGVHGLGHSVRVSQYSNEFGHNPGRFLSCSPFLHIWPHDIEPLLNTIKTGVTTRRIHDVGSLLFFILDLEACQYTDRATS